MAPLAVTFTISADKDIAIAYWFWNGKTRTTAETFTEVLTTPCRYDIGCQVHFTDGTFENVYEKNLVNLVDSDYDRLNTGITNKSFRFGVYEHQGIGFSENTGSWLFPETRTGTCSVVDNDGYEYLLVIDESSGSIYTPSLYNGPESTEHERLFKDKTDVNGASGTDITTMVDFKEHKGESERFFISNVSDSIFVRPIDIALADATGYDANGFPDNLVFDIYKLKDGCKIDEDLTGTYNKSIKAENVSIDQNELTFTDEIEGHRLQTRLYGNLAPYRITSYHSTYNVYDKYSINDRETTNTTSQSILSNCYFWISNTYHMNAVGYNAVTGTIGYDVNNGSLVESSTTPFNNLKGYLAVGNTTLENPQVVGVNSSVVMWLNFASLVPFTDTYTFTQYGETYNGWKLVYKNYGNAESGLSANKVLKNNVLFFDLRIIHAGLNTAALEYYYRDCIQNEGKNVLGGLF
jgi:hypothetical protein